MNNLSKEEISRNDAIKKAKEFFNNKTQFVSLLDRNMDPNHKD